MTELRAVLEIDGEDLDDIAARLEDVALRLRERGRAVPVEIVGSHKIVTVRSLASSPTVDWGRSPFAAPEVPA